MSFVIQIPMQDMENPIYHLKIVILLMGEVAGRGGSLICPTEVHEGLII